MHYWNENKAKDTTRFQQLLHHFLETWNFMTTENTYFGAVVAQVMESKH